MGMNFGNPLRYSRLINELNGAHEERMLGFIESSFVRLCVYKGYPLSSTTANGPGIIYSMTHHSATKSVQHGPSGLITY
jgi:hypothetical protein